MFKSVNLYLGDKVKSLAPREAAVTGIALSMATGGIGRGNAGGQSSGCALTYLRAWILR
jgi:hypothetical protein